MLQSLRISNLALLSELSLDLESGFTVVTGETGAGKSILLGALSLLAGERADKTIIRQGAEGCQVEARLFFKDPKAVNRCLEELDLPPCEEGVLILRRSIPREKAPRNSINGAMATLSALQRLGELWIDFHGPSEPRRLLKENCQLELLDLYARSQKQLEEYQKCFSEYTQLRAERQALLEEQQLPADQITFLEAQLAGLDALDLTPQSIEALERDFARLSRAQEIIETSSALSSGIDGEDGLSAKLAALLRQARALEGLDASSATLAQRLSSAAVELADIGAEYASLGQECQFDPEKAEELRTQMNAWLDAKRRFGSEVDAVLEAREKLRQRLARQGDLAGALERLDARIAQALKLAVNKAAVLRGEREKAARELAKDAAKGIAELGFKKADFRISIERLPELGASGDCRCVFLFSANIGEAPLPLGKIASSGELARVMLALKTVLADLDEVPVLVFDEVDANVGGEIGRVVGAKMGRLAKGHQVFCVTHLPQVAAQGAMHLLVEKDQSGARAEVHISDLSKNRKLRVGELARMLGDRNAKSAQAHAEELLSTKP